MLLKHSAQYLMARGLPGIVNFLAIALYTRMLSPDEYGRYALVITGVGLFNVIFFQWLRLSLLRFFPAHLENPRNLLSNILDGFAILVLLTGGMGLLLAWFWRDPAWMGLILIAIPLLWAQAWFDLNLELFRSRLQPMRYGLMNGVKAASALALGMVLIQWGLGAYGPLLGLLMGMLLVGFLWMRQDWGTPFRSYFAWETIKPLMLYGFPFTVNFALGFVVSSSDRFMLAWLLGEGAAGIYSAGYDLTWQTLSLLTLVINLAAYPLIVRAFENGGLNNAIKQLEQNVTLLLGIALPTTAGFALLSEPIARLALGHSFNEVALILPWVALAQLMFSIKVYHADLAYQLSNKTQYQTGIAGLAALVNVGLNLWWIPTLGIIGAAYATLIAYTVAMFASFFVGRSLLPVPIPGKNLIKLCGATLVMAGALLLLQEFGIEENSASELLFSVALGGLIYFAVVVLLNVAGSRMAVWRWLSQSGFGGLRS